jgi:hypothetical protein
MYENNERNVHQMLYRNNPIQGQENMYLQAAQGMPNQIYPTGVQGTHTSLWTAI